MPDRKELLDVLHASIALVTARVLNIPPGALVDPDRIARQQQAKADEELRLRQVDDHGNVMTPRLSKAPAEIDIDDLFYYATGVCVCGACGVVAL